MRDRKPARRRAQPKVPAVHPDPEVAAREPGPGARNRPGFDLGGAVGDDKPRERARATQRPGAAGPGRRSRPRVSR